MCSVHYLDTFAKWHKVTVRFVMAICLSAWNNFAPTGWIFLKFYIFLRMRLFFRKKKNCRENQNTHFMFSNLFLKIKPFMR